MSNVQNKTDNKLSVAENKLLCLSTIKLLIRTKLFARSLSTCLHSCPHWHISSTSCLPNVLFEVSSHSYEPHKMSCGNVRLILERLADYSRVMMLSRLRDGALQWRALRCDRFRGSKGRVNEWEKEEEMKEMCGTEVNWEEM